MSDAMEMVFQLQEKNRVLEATNTRLSSDVERHQRGKIAAENDAGALRAQLDEEKQRNTSLTEDVARLQSAYREVAGVVHQCPPRGSGIMPCCGRTPFEVMTERMTLDPLLVNCGRSIPPYSAPQSDNASIRKLGDGSAYFDRLVEARAPDKSDAIRPAAIPLDEHGNCRACGSYAHGYTNSLPHDPNGKLWIGYCDLCNGQHCVVVLDPAANIERSPHRSLPEATP